jgi:hypothetical protein
MQLLCADATREHAVQQKARTRAMPTFAWWFCVASTALAQADTPIPAFSVQEPGQQAISGWSPIVFRKASRRTQYSLVRESDGVVVHAHAEASASGLSHALHLDPKAYPILRWRWKIDRVVEHGEITRKHGDDYAARVYVTFDLDASRASLGERMRHRAGRLLFGDKLPGSGLCYVWDNRSATQTIVPNAYTPAVRMFVVESGNQQAHRWIEEERNVVDDYRRAFGADPPLLSGVAIMTDTDDTGEIADAWYGDVRLDAEPPRR